MKVAPPRLSKGRLPRAPLREGRGRRRDARAEPAFARDVHEEGRGEEEERGEPNARGRAEGGRPAGRDARPPEPQPRPRANFIGGGALGADFAWPRGKRGGAGGGAGAGAEGGGELGRRRVGSYPNNQS